jgi:hypothetical protein
VLHLDTLDVETAALRIGKELASFRVAAQYHPTCLQIVSDTGESCFAIVAEDGESLAGWIFGTITNSQYGSVLNSMPLVAYGGPVAKDQETEAALLRGLIEHGRKQDVDIVSVATHPLDDEATVQRYREHLQTDYAFENFVQLQTLDAHPLASMNARARSAFKRKLRRAAESLTVRQADSESDVERWLEIYAGRFDEINAKTYPSSFFHSMFRRSQQTPLAELWIAEHQGEHVGGVWLIVGKTCTDYFASAFNSNFNELQPGTLVMSEVFSSLVERQILVLNWQSSPGRDGVYEFKRRWGATECRHYYLTTILKPDLHLLRLDPPTLAELFPLRFVVPYSALRSECAEQQLSEDVR